MALLRAALVALLAAFASCAAHAEEHTIVIQHMEIQSIAGTMRAGDSLTFDNQADMAHNLYIIYADGSIDNFDTQVPGMKRTLTLRKAGPATIKCWIHPIIEAKFEILPAVESPETPKP